MPTKINPATIDQTLEQFKAQLLKEILEDAPSLTICYDNWFGSQIEREKRCLRTLTGESKNSAKVIASARATVEAWQRARELFLVLSAPALKELTETIAQQIEIEFAKHRLASSDVPANLRSTPLAEILKHLN